MVYFFFTYFLRFILSDANIDGESGNFLANINFASLLIVLISGVSLISFSVFQYMYIHTKIKKNAAYYLDKEKYSSLTFTFSRQTRATESNNRSILLAGQKFNSVQHI
jgi:hypothetical protein